MNRRPSFVIRRSVAGKVPLVIAAAVVLAACASEAARTSDALQEFRVVAPAPAAPATSLVEANRQVAGGGEVAGQQPLGPADGRRIVKTVQLSLGVDEPDDIADRIQQLAAVRGGYVAGLSSSNAEARHYQITIRVPVDSVADVLAELKGWATVVDHENLSSTDVTDQFVDLQARIRALEGTERELMALLAESRSRNHKVKDIMAIYTELTQIRSRIERHQGRLNVLENQSALATIAISLRPVGLPTVSAPEGWQPLVTVRDSYRVLVHVFQGLADGAIAIIVVGAPLALLGLAALWLLWKLAAGLLAMLVRTPAAE